MVNKDMNGFPVKKCSAFQFFKKRVRRWIKSPMVSVDKHQSPSLKYTGPPVVPIPPAEPDSEPPLCRSCLGDHAFQRAALPSEKESCSWETQSGCEVKEPCNHANILTKPDPRTFWTNDDSAFESEGRNCAMVSATVSAPQCALSPEPGSALTNTVPEAFRSVQGQHQREQLHSHLSATCKFMSL